MLQKQTPSQSAKRLKSNIKSNYISLAQVQSGKNLKKLKNEIALFLYRSKKLNE